jgi:hypothetical protein
MTQVVECLPTRAKALSSNPTITKKKKKSGKKTPNFNRKKGKIMFSLFNEIFFCKEK